MTIRLIRTTSPNLFVQNESLQFDRDRASQISDPIPPLAAMTFAAVSSTGVDDLEELARACGIAALSFAKSTIGTHCRIWLFVSQRPWQPASRLVRHRKLWRNYPRLIGSGSIASVSDEVEFASRDGIRFAGVLEVSEGSVEIAVEMTRTNPACAVICSQREDLASQMSIRSIFSSAFPKKNGIEQVQIDWMTLAINLCPLGDLLIRVSGQFNDREAAADVIGLRDRIVPPGARAKD